MTSDANGRVQVRPVVPSDASALAEYFANVRPENLRFRFLSSLEQVGSQQLLDACDSAHRPSIGFLATDATGKVVAVALMVADASRRGAEMAMSTQPGCDDKGVGRTLLQLMVNHAEAADIRTIEAVELADHAEALRMEREMGFKALACPHDPTLRIVRRELVS